jgi:predicted RecB family nuclease
MKIQEAKPYSPEEMKKGISTLLDANFTFGDLEAYADVLTRVEQSSSQIGHIYVPTIVIGTYKLSKDQKLLLAFSGYVLSKLQKEKVPFGTIITNGNVAHIIKLESLYKEIESLLMIITKWVDTHNSESPPIILNNHCPLCPFLETCEKKSL